MRKWMTLLMTLLVGASISQANANTSQVTLEAGYRHDNLSWRTKFPSSSPFLTTNTKFKDIDIFQIGIHGRSTIGCNCYIRGNAYFGWILDGDFDRHVNTYFSPGGYSDFEFGFNNDRHNVIDDKWVYGVGAAIGYPFYFCDCSIVLAPVVGYAVDEQTFEVEDEGIELYRDCDVIFPVSGSQCCNQKWMSRWYGPFVGIDFNYRPFNECWSLYAEVEYHWADFHGKRHTNSEFSHYGFDHNRFHSDEARAWVVSLGGDYDLCNCWTVGLAFKFQDWSANRSHRFHQSRHSGNNECNNDRDFCCEDRERHHFKWHSYEIKLALGREF